MKSKIEHLIFLNESEKYRSIKRLFLNGSGRVVTPYPYYNLESWLEDSPQKYTETVIDSGELEDLARGLHLLPNQKKILKGAAYHIFHEEHHIDEESSTSPFAVFGKVEYNGTLSVLAFFKKDEDGDIERIETATVTNYEVEWIDIEDGMEDLKRAFLQKTTSQPD